MDNLYSRQEKLNLTPIKSAAVVGVGGTGFWTAKFLAMSGCPSLDLYDHDHFELSNFARIDLPAEEYMGRNKAEGAADYLHKIRPDCQINTYGLAGAFTLAMTDAEVLFDCTDAQRTQLELSKWCKENKRAYIRSGYNGTHFTVTSHSTSWRTGEEITGYTIVPSWVVPAAVAAGLAVAKALYCPSINLSLDLSEIGGKSGTHKQK